MVIEIILGVSVVVNIGLLIGVRNLNKQNEQYQDYIETEISSTDEIRSQVQLAYEKMRDADIKGSFESDDEVGSAFTQLKTIVEELNNEV
tara:strand:- start:5548 stop:5817 length:270 start_codon:yes stop_codon:yes gene_type:complete